MALKTVADLKYSVAGILSGIDLANVDDLNGCLVRAASTLAQKADVPEMSGIQNIVLYSGIYDYACDPRIFGTAINDIRPQGITRSPNNFVRKIGQLDFDRTKSIYYPSGTTSTFEYHNGVPIIRIVAPFPKAQLTLDAMNDTTDWVAGGSASGLAQDTTVFYQSPASLRFLLTGSSTGTLTKTLSSEIDLSTYEDVGVAFLAIMIPAGATASNFTSISLRLGSSLASYDSVSNTTGFLGSWVAGQWLIVAFDFAGSTSTGTPDWTAIDYVQVRLAHTGTFTNFRVGGLWMSFPTPAQILYQSSAIFIASGTTTPATAITLDTDTIVLNDPAYNIYLQECALSVLQNTGAGASDATSIKINQMLHGIRSRNGAIIEPGLYGLFRGDNPSQEIRVTGSYYDNSSRYGRR